MILVVVAQNFERLAFLPIFFIIAFAVIWFIIGILLCIWVYRDAQSRGMEGALWLIIVLIANIIGVIVYLVVREERTETLRRRTQPTPGNTKFCIHCGHENPLDAKFCQNCGKEAYSKKP